MSKTKTKLVIAASLGLALLAAGGVALAGPGFRGGHGGGGFPGMMMMRMFSDLNLTDQQELKAIHMRKDIMKQAQEARTETFQQMGGAIDELGKATPDAQKLHGIADQAIQRFGRIVHSAIDQALELHATLTPEQRNTLVSRAKEIHQRREDRMERFNDDGAPKELKRPAPQKTR